MTDSNVTVYVSTVEVGYYFIETKTTFKDLVATVPGCRVSEISKKLVRVDLPASAVEPLAAILDKQLVWEWKDRYVTPMQVAKGCFRWRQATADVPEGPDALWIAQADAGKFMVHKWPQKCRKSAWADHSTLFDTVGIALYTKSKGPQGSVLVASTRKGELEFFAGNASISDESLPNAALRELKEESGDLLDTLMPQIKHALETLHRSFITADEPSVDHVGFIQFYNFDNCKGNITYWIELDQDQAGAIDQAALSNWMSTNCPEHSSCSWLELQTILQAKFAHNYAVNFKSSREWLEENLQVEIQSPQAQPQPSTRGRGGGTRGHGRGGRGGRGGGGRGRGGEDDYHY